MVLNPPLILVSALFFLSLACLLYLCSWLIAISILRGCRRWISAAAAKHVLMTALLAPPIIAAIPTVGGMTLKHSHISPNAEHHSMLCKEMYGHFLDATSIHGSEAAGILVNSVAWLAVLAGVFLFARLVAATVGLERGLSPYLLQPSPKLAAALDDVSRRMPGFRRKQFYECAVPAAYSSVFGLLYARCILSRSFVEDAPHEELAAVVAHEAMHIRSGDVSATFLVGALNCLFFALRPVRLLGRLWREAAEVACDDAAVAVTENPLAMASAILRMSGVPVTTTPSLRALPATTLAFADEAACPPSRRVERLIARAQRAASVKPIERTAQAAGAWAVTAMLSGLGIAMLFSNDAVCYAHCSLEAVAKLLP